MQCITKASLIIIPTFHYTQKATPRACSNYKRIQKDTSSFKENETMRYCQVKENEKLYLPALHDRDITLTALSSSNGGHFAMEYTANKQ
jgi:hypothetical protein